MISIGIEIKNNFPQKTVLYVPADRFMNQFVDSVKNNSQNEFVLAQIYGNLAEVEMRLGEKEDSLYYLAEATKILERKLKVNNKKIIIIFTCCFIITPA